VTADDLLAAAIAAARRKAKADLAAQHPDAEPLPIFPPERGGKNHLVRLDVAIMAVRLMALRIACRGLPNVFRNRIDQLVRTTTNMNRGKRWTASTLAPWSGVGPFVQMMNALQSLLDGSKIRGELRNACDVAGGAVLDEIRVSYMAAGKPLRKRTKDYVDTRHKSPRQRKKNKGWLPP